MRQFTRLLFTLLFSLFAAPLEAQEADDAFRQRVKADRAASGADIAWQKIAVPLVADPLYTLLGLDQLSYQDGNRFRYGRYVAVGGVNFEFNGDLYFSPAADDGAPYASMLALTTAPASGRLGYGTLKAQSAKLDIVVMNSGDAPKLHARLIPSFVGISASEMPYLDLRFDGKKLDPVLRGRALKLEYFAPSAADLDFLKDLAIDGVTQDDVKMTVRGRFKNKTVTVAVAAGEHGFTLTGENLLLADFLPEAAQVEYLSAFTFAKFERSLAGFTVAGQVAGKNLVVHKALGKTGFDITGDKLAVGDFAAAAADVPVLGKFEFKQMSYDGKTTQVDGVIGGRMVSVTYDQRAKTFDVTGTALTLADFLPAAADLPALAKFGFKSLTRTDAGLTVLGSIDGQDVRVDFAKGSPRFQITGAGLALTAFFADVVKLPYLKNFALDAVHRNATALAVTGKVDGKAVTVRTRAGGGFAVTGDGIRLTDFAPHTVDVPFLQDFAFTSLVYAKDDVKIAGTINGKAVSIDKSLAEQKFAVAGAGLTLADFVPAAADVPLLASFAFDELIRTPTSTEIDGKIAGKAVRVVADLNDRSLTVTGAALTLTDFLPAAGKVPFLSKFAFDAFKRSPHGAEVAGQAAGKAVQVARSADKKTLSVTGAALGLGDFIPAAAGVPFLKAFAFDSLTRDDSGLTAAGEISGKDVKVVQTPDGKFSVTGAALQLVNFVPAAAQVPVLSKFALRSVAQTPSGLNVSGTINGKAVTVARDAGAASFAVTAADLGLADFVPEVKSVPFLAKFQFDRFVYTPTEFQIAGKIDGKAVSVVENIAASTFKVSGADLGLADFVPAAANVPFLKTFAFDSLAHEKDEITVSGKINGKAVSVFKELNKDAFKVAGAALTLPDFVPDAAKLPFLVKFAFDSLSYGAAGVDVAGEIDNKAVSVVTDAAQKTFTVTGADLELADFVPDAAKVPFLSGFAFDGLTYGPAGTTVDGKIHGKMVAVAADAQAKTFKVTGADLALGDFVPQAADIPFLNAFVFDGLTYGPAGVEVDGKIGGAGVEIKKSDAGCSVTGAALTLTNFIPAADHVPALKSFALDVVDYENKVLTVKGKINGKPVTAVRDPAKNSFSVTGADLTLVDFVPQASSVQFLSAFAFDSLEVDPGEDKVTGKINGKAVMIDEDTAKQVFTVTGDDLRLADFVPDAAQVPFLNKFAFDKLVHSATLFDVEGKINGKGVTINKDVAAKTFTVSGDALGLPDFVPEAAKIPFLAKFAFDSLTYSAKELDIEGKISGKKVEVRVDNAAKTFVVRGADLELSDFVAEAKQLKFLDAFAFDSLSCAPSGVTVDGKLKGKAVALSAAFGAQRSFTAKGEGLQLTDILPVTSGVKAFDTLELDLLSVSAAHIEIDGKIAGKAIKFVDVRGGAADVTVTSDGLTPGDLFPHLKDVPTLGAVAIEKIRLDGKSIEVEVLLGGDTVDVVAHQSADQDKNFVAVFFSRLDAATFIPAAAGTPLDDMALDQALFVIAPQGAAAQQLAAKDLPGDLPKLASYRGTLNVGGGISLAADIDVAQSKTLAGVLNTVGIDAAALPLRGTLDVATFKGMGGKAKAKAASLAAGDKKSLLAGLSLSAGLPLPKLPALGGLVKVAGPVKLSLNGQAADPRSPWNLLPTALQKSKPAGDIDLSLRFGVQIVGSGIAGDLEALVNLSESAGAKGLTLLATYQGVWDKAFGVPGFNLYDGGFELALEESQGAKSEELAFFANVDLGKVKNAEVTADLLRKDGKITLNYFELDGKFDLTDLPGGSRIPAAHKFELDEIKASVDGVAAKMVFWGKAVHVYLFDQGTGGKPNFTFAIEQKNFSVAELLPAAKKILPLKALAIPQAALIISEAGIDVPSREQLGVIAKDMFDDLFGKSNIPVKLPSGIGLLADFDSKALGVLGAGLSKLGVHEDAIILGAITGIFQGAPGFMLELAMAQQGDAHGLPQKVVNYKNGVTPAFFIQWAGEDFYAGLKIATEVKAGKDTLELATSIELQFNEEGVGIKLLGEMDGIWQKPFGINGFNLANVKMDVGIDDVGEVEFGLAGDQQYGHCKNPAASECVDINLAMAVKILLEDALPDGVAFAGKVSRLGIPAILEIAESIMGLKGQLSKIPMPFFEVHDAVLAFATPGAADPQLGLVSEGFALGGQFFFMNKKLGEIQAAAGPLTGFVLKGDIADIDLDVLQFKNNNVDIAVNLQPKFIINSEVDLLGDKQVVKLDIEPPHFTFEVLEDLGHFGKADLKITLDGFDLKTGRFDKNADISVLGVFKSDLIPWMEGEVKKGIDELVASANAKLDADKKALDAAQSKVDGLNSQIRKIKAEDDKAKARAEASLQSAKNRVNSLQGTYDHQIHEAHHCGSHWTHWACSPGWYVAAGATWTVLKAAKGVLSAAEKVVAAAFDLDPRLAGLYAARDIASAALSVAKAVVEASEAVVDFVLHEVEKLLEAALKDFPLEIDEAIIIGDLRDMITSNDPLVFDMKFKMFGTPLREYFAVKIPNSAANLEFDAVSFALLPVLALDKMTEKALAGLAPAAARWFRAHIGAKLAEAETQVRAQVQAEEAKYKDVLASFENNSAKFKQAFAEQGAATQQIAAAFSITDLLPDSEQFQNTYLGIGHSRHCLTVSKDGLSVVQFACKDAAAERWSTAPLEDGYVQLKSKGLCLKGREGAKTDNFEPLILGPCDNKDIHEQWKVVSTDGFYSKIANRWSEKCLHFNEENANPQTAYAVWSGCMGADSQQFRPLADAERPTWHAVKEEIKSKSGLCLGVKDADERLDLGGWLHIDIGLRFFEMFARKCDDVEERFNYVEMPDGDIKIVSASRGMCVYPQEIMGRQRLGLRACDSGKDMLWRVEGVDGSFDKLRNLYRNQCLTMPSPPKNSSVEQNAALTACASGDAGTLIDFAK